MPPTVGYDSKFNNSAVATDPTNVAAVQHSRAGIGLVDPAEQFHATGVSDGSAFVTARENGDHDRRVINLVTKRCQNARSVLPAEIATRIAADLNGTKPLPHIKPKRVRFQPQPEVKCFSAESPTSLSSSPASPSADLLTDDVITDTDGQQANCNRGHLRQYASSSPVSTIQRFTNTVNHFSKGKHCSAHASDDEEDWTGNNRSECRSTGDSSNGSSSSLSSFYSWYQGKPPKMHRAESSAAAFQPVYRNHVIRRACHMPASSLRPALRRPGQPLNKTLLFSPPRDREESSCPNWAMKLILATAACGTAAIGALFLVLVF